MKQIYVQVAGKSGYPLRLEFDAGCSDSVVHELFCAAAGVHPKCARSVLRLTRQDGTLLAISREVAANTPEASYQLEARAVASCGAALDSSLGLSMAGEAHSGGSGAGTLLQPHVPTAQQFPKHVFSAQVRASLQLPTFSNWEWSETQLLSLIAVMFEEFGLLAEFGIDAGTFRSFLYSVRTGYNKNPFHNFNHCFCVTQMAYSLLHQTGLAARLRPLDVFCVLLAALGHDLDHPGVNNAYLVNAQTDLAVLYNDQSPLENHHAACLFGLLRFPETNILAHVSDATFREMRKTIIRCILATDMARHGDIMAAFKAVAEHADLQDAEHRALFLQMVIKLADISNEVRPKAVADPWVDALLEEFFAQSDREKAEGLPFTPFMDREKVSKPNAQVGFIQFVLLPLYELAAKHLPNLERLYVVNIRASLAYYQSAQSAQAASASPGGLGGSEKAKSP